MQGEASREGPQISTAASLALTSGAGVEWRGIRSSAHQSDGGLRKDQAPREAPSVSQELVWVGIQLPSLLGSTVNVKYWVILRYILYYSIYSTVYVQYCVVVEHMFSSVLYYSTMFSTVLYTFVFSSLIDKMEEPCGELSQGLIGLLQQSVISFWSADSTLEVLNK